MEVVVITIMDGRFGSNLHLLTLLHTRETRIPFHQPSLSPTPHTMLKTSTCNFHIALGGEAERNSNAFLTF